MRATVKDHYKVARMAASYVRATFASKARSYSFSATM
jgi:hypothetical protein